MHEYSITAVSRPTLGDVVLLGQTTFFCCSLRWQKKGLVWFTVATCLGIPTAVEGVNDGKVICYCSIATHANSVVLYKRVSLKFIACKFRSEVSCFNK